MGIFSWLSDRFKNEDRKLSHVHDEDSLSSDVAESVDQVSSETSTHTSTGDVLEDLARQSDTLSVPTLERIGLLFDAQEWKWQFDQDGDIASAWDRSMFYFRMIGKQKEIFSVFAIRRGLIAREHRSELLLTIEDWHRTYLWPKGYFREAEGDALEVCAEFTIDLEHGVTDEQLLVHCRCAIATTLQFFEEIDQRFGVPEDPSDS